MSGTKQKSSAAKNVAIFFVVFIILEMLVVFGVSKVFKNEKVTPSIAGFSMYLMDSDKMGEDVPNGSLVIAANGTPSVEGIGKAVLAENVKGVGTSVFWLLDVTSENDEVVYTIYQEKDPSTFYKVKPSNIVGEASSYYKVAGSVIGFVSTNFGMAVCAIAPLFLLVLIELIIAIASRSSDEDEDDEYEDDEDDEDDETVTLDDFLYGGENEKVIHQPKKQEKPVAAPKRRPDVDIDNEFDFSIRKAAQPAERKTQPVAKEKPVAPVVSEEKEAPAVDPVYYEKASRFLDEGEASNDVKVGEPVAKPAASNSEINATKKTASASLEQLMKLMEEEQKKLRNQLNK